MITVSVITGGLRQMFPKFLYMWIFCTFLNHHANNRQLGRICHLRMHQMQFHRIILIVDFVLAAMMKVELDQLISLTTQCYHVVITLG